MPYLALTYHTRYTILKKNEEIIKNNVKLTCNISEFDAGFVACEGVNDSMQIYFMFVTRKGQIITAPV